VQEPSHRNKITDIWFQCILMTLHKVDTVIYQPRGSDVHRSQRLR
jgi:hypothetical protein